MVDADGITLNIDRERVVVGALTALAVYAIIVEMRQRRQQNQHLREIRRILNPYYDIQSRSWKDPSDVDPTSSNIEVGVSQNLDDPDEDAESEESDDEDTDDEDGE